MPLTQGSERQYIGLSSLHSIEYLVSLLAMLSAERKQNKNKIDPLHSSAANLIGMPV
jgi:hypothetical protein